jgi:hypothetical protein
MEDIKGNGCGAPRKNPALLRNVKLIINLTDFEKTQLVKFFEKKGMILSEGVRQALAECVSRN